MEDGKAVVGFTGHSGNKVYVKYVKWLNIEIVYEVGKTVVCYTLHLSTNT